MLTVMKKLGFSLYFLLIQQLFLTEAYQICNWNNLTAYGLVTCSDSCCTGIGLSPDTACCSSTSWSTLVIPIFVVTGVCLFAVCLIYFRPLCKQCLCRCKCPCGNRTRVTSTPPHIASVNATPVYHINNDDLPDYETISKIPRPKDMTPPPYNFVAAHPTDFGIEMSVLNAPPQYRSRCSSVATVVQPLSRIDS